MDVPRDLIEHGLEHVHGDEADARFDQAPREQAALAETVLPVFLAHGFGLAMQFERLARLLRRHQRVRLLERGIEQPRVGGRFERAHRFIHHLAPVLAAIHAEGREVVGRQHVRDLEVRVARIGVEHERVVALAEIAGVLPVGHVPAGVADGPRQQHVRGDIALRALELVEHAAVVRMLQAAEEEASGLHHLMAGIVYRGGGVIHAADQRELVGVFGGAREVFRDFDARDVGGDRFELATNFGRCIQLEIECILVRRPARQVNHDH